MKRFVALVLSLVMALSLCAPAWGSEGELRVTDAEGLAKALAAGGEILVEKDIEVDADNTINVTGKAVLDLNGHTIAGVSDQTGANRSLIVVGKNGDLTVKNGSVTMKHEGDNMGWSNSTNALEAVSGGKLTLENVSVKNLGGSDMAYAVNIGNNGGATLKTDASTIESENYVALRIFNNADGNINVDLTNGSVLTGNSSPFFVHFWSEKDLGDKQNTRQKCLKVNFNDTKVSRYSGSKSLVRFGFDDAIYFSGTDMTEVVAGSEAALKWALENDKNVLLNNDLSIDATLNVTKSVTIDGNGYKITNAGETTNSALMLGDSTWGEDQVKTCNITLKNIVFDGWTTDHVVRVQGVTATIDNCTFQNCKQGAEGLHGLVSTTSTSDVTVQNCTFDSNECNKAIHFDDNAAANTLVVKNNTFAKNVVSNAAVIFFGDYGTYSATGNIFNDNTVKPAVATNAGIIYGANMTVTGNTFKNNHITHTSARGGVVVADAGTIKENIFSGNTLAKETTQETTYVATIVQKGGADTSIDANANYWGDGKAAVAGEDYVIAKDGGAVAATTYYSTVTDGKLSGLVDPNAPKPPVYYPPAVDTPTEKPAETPTETPTQTPAQTPAQPAPSTEVTMGGSESAVKVEATVTGTTAAIEKIDTAQMETVIDSAGETGKVTIDFSAVTAAPESGVENAVVDTVEIPAEVIAQIAEAVADPENKAESLEIVLGDGASIEFDAAALAEKVAQAGGESIEISIKPTTAVAERLSDAQLFTVGESVAFDITVTSGGVAISDMGGNITITAPYALAEGETAEGIVVYYVDDEGNREKCETSYDAG